MAGPIKPDIEKQRKARRLLLDEIIKVLESEPTEQEEIKYRKELVLKLAVNALPRINEHKGADEEDPQPILVKFINGELPVAVP